MDMQSINFPVGISDFEKIRTNHYYYVDKSGLISELLEKSSAEVTLITRPRRFGKTLGMSMLANFFDIRKDSRALFEGLEITSSPSLCQKWMNQCPAIFLSLKDIDGLTFQNAYSQLETQISELYKQFTYLCDCDRIDSDDKRIFLLLKTSQATHTQLSRSLSLLMRMMHQYYQKPVILLLDEYDVPLAKASNHGYYPQMLEIIKTMMSTALKDNPSLGFAVITGCLKIAKESIFTGTNNFVSDTISSSRLNEYFGFTQKEVDRLLKDANASKAASSIKRWYDGYHFGEFDVYCPWDVINYLRDLQRNPHILPAGYWKNTSDNAIIRSFIDHSGPAITQKLETLLSGGYILQSIDENLTYDYLHSSEENLWSILYLTGYLTKLPTSALASPLPQDIFALTIPNAEIQEIFETTILKWFQDSAKTWNKTALLDAVWNADPQKLTLEMTSLLRRTISYHDYHEDFYHAFLAGIFTGAGYVVDSNKEHGEGRSDIVVYDPLNSRVAVFEVKCSKTLKNMKSDCQKALLQIEDRKYTSSFADDYDQIFCYGISFFRKRCLAAAET